MTWKGGPTPFNALKLLRSTSAGYGRSTSRLSRQCVFAKPFHSSLILQVVKPFLLADIGEGIRECQIIQWFVKPGARVEQFDKLCEVQSDKASVEITSRFDGVIKKLHYEPDDMAIVGKPLVDIDIQSEITPEDEVLTTPPAEQAEAAESAQQAKAPEKRQEDGQSSDKGRFAPHVKPSVSAEPTSTRKHATLATPAVRHLIKEHDIEIQDIVGSGKDGRVLKEDVQNFISSRSSSSQDMSTSASEQGSKDTIIPLTPVQAQMFKIMTRSLNIPHFLYTDAVDLTSLTNLRRRLNAKPHLLSTSPDVPGKLSALSFIIKAISMSLQRYPILNARIDTSTDSQKPQLVMRANHNVGVAVDTPQGLLVPVIKGVQNLSITSIAAELRRLSALAQAGKLSAQDITGGTFTVSNVGSIGGGVVSPVIVEGQVAIVGIGKAKTVPAFDADGNLKRKEEVVFSWSADHRVVDGATVARCAESVKEFIESVEAMVVSLRRKSFLGSQRHR